MTAQIVENNIIVRIAGIWAYL